MAGNFFTGKLKKQGTYPWGGRVSMDIFLLEQIG